MSIIDKLSVRTSMLGTFAMIALVTISFGIFSMSGMTTLGKLTETLYNHPLRVSNAALMAQCSILRMQRDMKDITTKSDVHDFNLLIISLNNEEKNFYKHLNIVNKFIIGERGRDLAQDAKQSFSKWKPIRDKAISFFKDGNSVTSKNINNKESDSYAKNLEIKMEDLTLYARNKADGFIANARNVQTSIARNTLYMLITLITLFFFLSWIVMKHIVGRLSHLTEALSKSEKLGQLIEVEIEGNSSNEISNLGKSFNSLIKTIKKQLWLREGVNNLNQLLMEVNRPESFGKNLSFMARYIDAGVAALFEYDSVSGESVLLSSYSMNDKKSDIKRYELGQGPVGQVARDMEEIYLTGKINSDLCCSLYSGIILPQSVFIIPLIFKKELVGVAEFTKMGPFKEIEKDFVKFSGAFLAGAINSIKNRTQIDKLFNETRASNEKLQRKKVENEEINRQLSKRNSELAEKSEELEMQTDKLTQQAQQLKQQKEELVMKQEQVKQSDRLKSEFLSNMSHELRTPLNSILALSQLMLRRRSDHMSSKENEYISVIERNGRLLLSLISNILDLSKIESGRMDMTFTCFDAAEVVKEVLETMTPLAEKKGLDLKSEIIFQGQIRSDRHKILQILLNLSSNAIKFTDSGQVTIRLEKIDNQISYSVSDSGIGIPKDKMSYIFGEFQQVDGSPTKRHDGTGLGLSISRKFARMLGGDITVENLPTGGSLFRLCFEEKDAPATTTDSHISKKSTGKNLNSVLIVDDMESHREVIRKYLEDAGYAAIECDQGQEALAIAKKTPLHAIILDILMPGMDGWEVLQSLKEDPDTKDIPVILLSISNDETTGLALGASGYLSKPPEREALLAEIEEVSKKKFTKTFITSNIGKKPLRFLQNILQQAGYEIFISDSVNESFDLIKKSYADIVIIDYHPEGEDIFPILDEICADPDMSNIPLIILTPPNVTINPGKLQPNFSGEFVQTEEIIENSSLQIILAVKKALKKIEVKIIEKLNKAKTGNGIDSTFGENKTILAVEDNAENVMVLKEVLSNFLGQILVAENGEEAISMASSVIPDLILMDIHLPGMNGVDATKIIKAGDKTNAIPIIALTARAMSGDREKFTKAGCDDYLTKPYDPEILIKTVHHWLEKGQRTEHA